jgi:hypothetical protein
MKDQDSVHKFIELRSQGVSFARIVEHFWSRPSSAPPVQQSDRSKCENWTDFGSETDRFHPHNNEQSDSQHAWLGILGSILGVGRFVTNQTLPGKVRVNIGSLIENRLQKGTS